MADMAPCLNLQGLRIKRGDGSFFDPSLDPPLVNTTQVWFISFTLFSTISKIKMSAIFIETPCLGFRGASL